MALHRETSRLLHWIPQEKSAYGLKVPETRESSKQLQTETFLAEKRNQLAQERTLLAHERTYFAKQRLFVALIALYIGIAAFGITILHIFEQSQLQNIMYTIAGILIIIALLGIWISVKKYREVQVFINRLKRLKGRARVNMENKLLDGE